MRRSSPRFFLAATTAVILSVFSAKADAPVYVRVALVMGNAAYVSAPPLANPGNDAKAMAQTLRSQGFSVIEVVNGNKNQMQSGIAKIRDTLRGQAGIGMLYYAGHGLQLNDHNFMVPVDAKLNKANDIPKETVDVSEAIAAFKSAGNRMNIIVLDACRDNPFGRSTSLKGLAPIDAPAGTFLAYATAPGNVAEDGDEKSANGLYTSFLLQEMKRPNARIEDVFKRVRYQVRQKSDGRQVPWESTSLEEDFVFTDGKIIPPAKFTPETAKNAYETELAEWKKIGDSRNVNDYYAFIQKHPNSALTLSAQGKIEDLAKTKLLVQGGGADGQSMPLSLQPFRTGQKWATRVSGATINKESLHKVIGCDDSGCHVEQLMTFDTIQSRMVMHHSPSGGLLSLSIMSSSAPKPLSTIDYDPPVYLVPPGLLQIGQRWKNASVAKIDANGKINTMVTAEEGKVISREILTTPAGTFDTFRLEVKHKVTSTYSNDEMEIDFVFWMDPKLPVPVKHTITHKNNAAMNTSSEIIQYSQN